MAPYLTEEQGLFPKAAKAGQNILGVARAGTGKTTTGIEVCKAVAPGSVLYVAFAKVNAEDIQRKAPNNTRGQTTHSYGRGVVLKNVRGAKYDQWKTANLCQKVLGRNATRQDYTTLGDLVGKGKNSLATTVSQMTDLAYRFNCFSPDESRWNDEAWSTLALDVMRKCREMPEVMDFDDMIYLPAVNPDWRHDRFDYVILDEAQDINAAQEALMRAAVGKFGRFMSIGDDRQSMYAFRGADPNAMLRLAEHFKSTKLAITATFRCGRNIVEAAKQLVPDYKCASNFDGEVLENVYEEMLEGVEPGDAILSRSNAPLVPICFQLLRNGVRAGIRGKDIGGGLKKMVERSKTRDVNELMEWLISFRQKEAERLTKAHKEEEIDAVNDRVETVIALAEGAESIEILNRRFDTLFDDKDDGGGEHQDRGRVLLSSTHKAKGLEWDRVWLLRDTYRHAPDASGDWTKASEENNIRYVALTRGKTLVCDVTQVPFVKKPKTKALYAK